MVTEASGESKEKIRAIVMGCGLTYPQFVVTGAGTKLNSKFDINI